MAITDLIPWNRGRRQVPVRREEEHPFLTLQRDMNRLFDEFFGGSWLAPFRTLEEEWSTFYPRVDVAETDAEIKVTAELPGLEPEDFEVSLSEDTLTIRGEKRQEREEKGRNYYRAERSYGSFQRSIPLPHIIDADKVNAEFSKGVLTVSLPKIAAREDRKKIVVKTK